MITRSDLDQRLARLYSVVDDKVVQQLILLFAPQLHYANDELLGELYDLMQPSPLGSTRAILKASTGLVFPSLLYAKKDGAMSTSRSMLLLGFWEGFRPVICKFTLDPQDALREHKVLDDLWKEPAVTGIVGPVELLTFQSGSRGFAPHGISERRALVMPVYPATLQHIPVPISAPSVLTWGKQLKACLEQIHSKGYGHNDIKAANVFLTAKGECILADFGSALPLGQPVNELTTTHWPAELENPNLSLDDTSAAVDFFQLAVTLLERVGGLMLQRKPTPAMCRAAASALDHAELHGFVLDLLRHQE